MAKDTTRRELLPPEHDEPDAHVFELRGYLVMLATRVAEVFRVQTREIVQNNTRNNDGLRPLFPERYAFQVTKEELERLRSLGVISKPGRGGSRFVPHLSEAVIHLPSSSFDLRPPAVRPLVFNSCFLLKTAYHINDSKSITNKT